MWVSPEKPNTPSNLACIRRVVQEQDKASLPGPFHLPRQSPPTYFYNFSLPLAPRGSTFQESQPHAVPLLSHTTSFNPSATKSLSPAVTESGN